jgi:hypothetical protein
LLVAEFFWSLLGVGVEAEGGVLKSLSERQKQPKTKQIKAVTNKKFNKFRRNDWAADSFDINYDWI